MKQSARFRNSLLLVFFILYSITIGQQKVDTLKISEYLLLNPIETPMPASIHTPDGKQEIKKILTFEDIETSDIWPSSEDEYIWSHEIKSVWKSVKTQNGKIQISEKPLNLTNTAYLAFYLSTDRFIECDLKIKSPQMLNVFLDGKTITKKDSYEEPDEEGNIYPGLITTKLKLESGKHLVLIKSVSSEEMNQNWFVESWIEYQQNFTGCLNTTLNNITFVDFKELLDNRKVTDVSISPDGNIAAIALSQRDLVEDKDEKWIELYDTEEGTLISTFKGGFELSSIDWAPEGVMFAYQTSGSTGGSIWIYDLSSGENYELLKNVKDLAGFIWAPDAGSIFYTTSTTPEPKDKNFKKYEKIEDRWPYGNDVSTIYQVFLPNGVKRKLTTSDFSASLGDISPDGKKLIFSTTKYDATKWPFSSSTFYLMDLKTFKTDSLFELIFAGEVKFSPDGNNLLVKGGPSTFNGIGKNVPKNRWPNDYDNQAFIYNLNTKTIDPITKNFDPSIDDMYWVKGNNTIYFRTSDKSFKHLYRYNVKNKSYKYVELDDEYVTKISFALDGSKAVYISESSNEPRRVFTLDLATENISMLLDPDAGSFEHIQLGAVEDYTFESESGKNILGRVYYPPDFDGTKKYPLIVHYYGGTGPIDRNFEGRYPQNIWAANGYVVYTLQPSGSVGFGQEFSAAHVNDWGETSAQEIIEGAEEFIAEHDFIDSKRVGCIGASYGGFMTMSLLTKTDMFRAGIAHAGISTLTSYWGEGYWGPSYSAVATANSYPWNRKDIYVDKSPIYSADKINTPLLLLHGNIDPNVPKGESWSMYAALKILGKDVEFVEIDQQGHWIMDYHKRNKWSRTILAYFDKYLKDQPEWWEDLYK